MELSYDSRRASINRNKQIKRKKESLYKYKEQEFWKRARNVQFQKQSRNENFVCDEPEVVEPEVVEPEVVEPEVVENANADVDLKNIALHSMISMPEGIHQYPPDNNLRFCDLGASLNPVDAETMIEKVETALKQIRGTIVFFPELTLWKCSFFGESRQTFEVRMWHDNWRFMLTAMRTSGSDLDGEPLDENFERLWRTNGSNETFFQNFCLEFDAPYKF
jgi:hypothetical protein